MDAIIINTPNHPPGSGSIPTVAIAAINTTPPRSLPSVSSEPIALKPNGEPAEFEIVLDHPLLVAIIIQRELSCDQMFTVSRFIPAHNKCTVDGQWTDWPHLAQRWEAWRVYAPTWWATHQTINETPRPSGPHKVKKLYFAR